MKDRKRLASGAAEVEQLANTHQLGVPGLSFKESMPFIRRSFAKAILCIILVPPALLIWTLITIVALNLLVLIHVIWLIVILFLISMSIYIIPLCYGVTSVQCALNEKKRCKYLEKEQIHLFEHGFVYWDEKKDILSAIRWEHIKGLDTCSRQKGTQWLTGLTILTNMSEDKTWTEHFCLIPDLPDLQEICTRINRAYIDYQLPLRLQSYERGETLKFDFDRDSDYDGSLSLEVIHFGLLEISQEGIKQVHSVTNDGGYFIEDEKEEFIVWDEVASIEMEGQRITIKIREPRLVEGVNSAIWLAADVSFWGEASLLKELLGIFATK